MKKIIFAFCILFLLFSTTLNRSYDLKIEFDIKNKNPIKIDEYYAVNIEEELIKLKEIKNISIFSTIYGCNIYCKLKLFCNKEKTIEKIQRKFNSLNFKNYTIDDKYNLKYDYFIVITDTENDYYKLKTKTDEIYNRLLRIRYLKDAKIIGLQQKVNYIYFSSLDLLNYDITIEDLKNIIKTSNIKKNFIQDNSLYYTSLNNHINDIEDIKKIPLKFKNSIFFTTLGEVFDIKKDIQHPLKQKIIYNDKDAIVIGISTDYWFSELFLKFILKEYNIKIINPKQKEKVKIYLNKNSNIENSIKWLTRNKLKGLFFIGLTPPKTKNKEEYDEIIPNRIIGFVDIKEKKKINNTENNIPQNLEGFEYNIKEYKLNSYLSKKELTDFLFSNSDGLFCDYYTDKKDKVNILLKSKDNFIYSKKYKTLISINEITEKRIKKHKLIIYRKNGKNIIIKNPF